MRRATGRSRRFPVARGRAWTPLSDADTVLWLDAIASPRTESSGLVSQLNDLSPNGYHATAGTGLEPTYDATALGGEYPALTAASGGKQLLTPALAALEGATGCTVFLVAAIPTSTANRIALEYGTNGGFTGAAGTFALYDNISNANSLTNYVKGSAGSNFWRSAADSESLTTHKVITLSWDFTAAAASEIDAIRSNGTALSGAQTGTSENVGAMSSQVLSIFDRVSTGASVAMQFGALVIVKRHLSDDDKLRFERYLGGRFGLPFEDAMATRAVPRILYAGQSNALGQLDDYDEISKWHGPHSDPLIRAYKSTEISAGTEVVDTWGPMREHQPSGSAWEAPDLPMAATLVRHKSLAPEVIVCAKGATSLAVDWDPDASSGMFDRLETTLANALSTHPDAPASHVPWLVWIQGENDAADATRAANYEANLTAFLAAVRALDGMTGAKVVIVKLHADNGSGAAASVAAVRAAQEAVVAADDDAYIVSIDDLTLQSDTVHYTETTAIEVGRRIAAVIGANT